jgi:energy-coupling factor transporter transmembrane protein EcfT
MDLRCFGTHPRTWLIKLTYLWTDIVLIAGSALLFIVSFVLSVFLGLGGFTVPPWFLSLFGIG